MTARTAHASYPNHSKDDARHDHPGCYPVAMGRTVLPTLTHVVFAGAVSARGAGGTVVVSGLFAGGRALDEETFFAALFAMSVGGEAGLGLWF
jgi:hypothetical protein